MANIESQLNQMLGARFGRDVRQSLYEAIDAVNRSAEGSALAAETAQAGAETAKRGAETAKAGAETARQGAETAQTGAETAKAGAEAARQGAETAQTGAEAARQGAETAQTGAETAKAGAEAARRGAETAQTEAETAKEAAKSWAVGMTGIREGEDTNCSEFFSRQSQNSAALSEDYYKKTKQAGDNAINALNGAIDRINQNTPKFWINPEDGILYHTASRFTWVVNRITGQLEWGLTV